MGEIVTFPGEYERRLEAAERLGQKALSEITARYGSGENTADPSAKGGLAYHNVQHTLRVREHAGEMATAVGLSEYATALAVLAASAHDLDHSSPRGEMELLSAQWLAHAMHRELFPQDDIRVAVLGVLGTEPLFEAGAMTGQKVSQLKYPSQEAELIGRVVACADMADMYSARGPLLGLDLYRESWGALPGSVVPMSHFAGFQRQQLALTRNYRFPLEEGEQLYGVLRPSVVEFHEAVLGVVETGQVTRWDQLVGLSQGFCDRHTA